MRRQLITTVLPLFFALLPIPVAVLIVATLPPIARDSFVKNATGLDYVILGLGSLVFFVQTYLAYRSLRWQGTGFDEAPDKWLTNLAQSAEWFPLLGLIGTVAAIMQTFQTIDAKTPPGEIIRLYAPALTATGSGLLMSLVNIFPAWVAVMGRGLILTLAGDRPSPEEGRP